MNHWSRHYIPMLVTWNGSKSAGQRCHPWELGNHFLSSPAVCPGHHVVDVFDTVLFLACFNEVKSNTFKRDIIFTRWVWWQIIYFTLPCFKASSVLQENVGIGNTEGHGSCLSQGEVFGGCAERSGALLMYTRDHLLALSYTGYLPGSRVQSRSKEENEKEEV